MITKAEKQVDNWDLLPQLCLQPLRDALTACQGESIDGFAADFLFTDAKLIRKAYSHTDLLSGLLSFVKLRSKVMQVLVEADTLLSMKRLRERAATPQKEDDGEAPAARSKKSKTRVSCRTEPTIAPNYTNLRSTSNIHV